MLNGEIGIFLPRNPEQIRREAKLLELVKQLAGEDGGVTQEALGGLLEKNNFDEKEKEFLTAISMVLENKIYYKLAYLEARLGKLYNSKALSAEDFFDENSILKFEFAGMKKKGDMFGEIALIYKLRRNAHCVALVDTSVALLDADNFHKIFGAIQEAEERFKKNFFERFIFKDPNLWLHLKTVTRFFQKRKFNKGYHFFKTGDPTEKIFVLVSGQVLFWVMAEQKGTVNAYSNKDLKASLRGVNKSPLNLCILKEGELLGEENILEDSERDKKAYCAVADTECLVYETNKKGMMAACEQVPLLKNFFKAKSDAKKAIITHMKEKILRNSKDNRSREKAGQPMISRALNAGEHYNTALNVSTSTQTPLDLFQDIDQLKIDFMSKIANRRLPGEAGHRKTKSNVAAAGAKERSFVDFELVKQRQFALVDPSNFICRNEGLLNVSEKDKLMYRMKNQVNLYRLSSPKIKVNFARLDESNISQFITSAKKSKLDRVNESTSMARPTSEMQDSFILAKAFPPSPKASFHEPKPTALKSMALESAGSLDTVKAPPPTRVPSNNFSKKKIMDLSSHHIPDVKVVLMQPDRLISKQTKAHSTKASGLAGAKLKPIFFERSKKPEPKSRLKGLLDSIGDLSDLHRTNYCL